MTTTTANHDSNSTAGNAPAFTPGPWQFIETGTENAAVRISQDCVVSGSYNGGDSDLLSHANARLIAAAPELLDHHQAILNYAADVLCHINAEHPAFNFVKAIHHEARVAIARATA